MTKKWHSCVVSNGVYGYGVSSIEIRSIEDQTLIATIPFHEKSAIDQSSDLENAAVGSYHAKLFENAPELLEMLSAFVANRKYYIDLTAGEVDRARDICRSIINKMKSIPFYRKDKFQKNDVVTISKAAMIRDLIEVGFSSPTDFISSMIGPIQVVDVHELDQSQWTCCGHTQLLTVVDKTGSKHDFSGYLFEPIDRTEKKINFYEKFGDYEKRLLQSFYTPESEPIYILVHQLSDIRDRYIVGLIFQDHTVKNFLNDENYLVLKAESETEWYRVTSIDESNSNS